MKLKIRFISLKVAVQSCSMWCKIWAVYPGCKVWRIPLSWNVTLYHWMCGFWSFKGEQVDQEDFQDELRTWVYTGKTWLIRNWMEFCQASRKMWEVSCQQMDRALQMAVIGWMFEGWSLMGSEQARWCVQDHRVGNTLEERANAVHREQPPPLDCVQYRDRHHHHHHHHPLLYSATTSFCMVNHPVINPSIQSGGHF